MPDLVSCPEYASAVTALPADRHSCISLVETATTALIHFPTFPHDWSINHG